MDHNFREMFPVEKDVPSPTTVCPHGFPGDQHCGLCAVHHRPADDPSRSYSPGAYDGGQAFPQTRDLWERTINGTPVPSGMSLRDYYAGEAMRSLVVHPNAKNEGTQARARVAARAAFIYASEMISERERTT